MEVAPGILARTFTAPVSSHSRMNNSQSSSATPNTFSIGSRPSRSSNSTQDTTASLFALRTSPPPNGTIIEATNNVINRVAEKETSLYQQCITLRKRLRAVPGFNEEYQRTVSEAAHAQESPSSVDLLWMTFRRGFCLVFLFNACQPLVEQSVWQPIRLLQTATNEQKREKDASYKFIQACHQQLKLPQSEIFMLAELNGEDTAGLVKVCTTEVVFFMYILTCCARS
jgi:cell division control protein 24